MLSASPAKNTSGSNVDHLDEVGALRVLLRNFGDHRVDRAVRWPPVRISPAISSSSGASADGMSLPLRRASSSLGRARHLPEAGDAVGQHQRQAAFRIGRIERVAVKVVEARHDERAVRVDRRRTVRAARCRPVRSRRSCRFDDDRHAGREAAVARVDDGDTVENDRAAHFSSGSCTAG